jgi:hypothetical protein
MPFFTGQASKHLSNLDTRITASKHPCVYTCAPAHSHTGARAHTHTQGSFKVSAIARKAEEADSEVVTSVIIVKARCAPPQFHPLSRTINLPLVPAAPEASPYRAAAAAMGNGRERRGGQKGGGGGEEDRRQLFLKSLDIVSVCSKFSRALTLENLCRAPGTSISLSTKTWDVMPDAKIHVSVFALKCPVGECVGVPVAAAADGGDGHGAQEVSPPFSSHICMYVSSSFLALALSPLPPCQHTHVKLTQMSMLMYVHVHGCMYISMYMCVLMCLAPSLSLPTSLPTPDPIRGNLRTRNGLGVSEAGLLQRACLNTPRGSQSRQRRQRCGDRARSYQSYRYASLHGVCGGGGGRGWRAQD